MGTKSNMPNLFKDIIFSHQWQTHRAEMSNERCTDGGKISTSTTYNKALENTEEVAKRSRERKQSKETALVRITESDI